MYYIPDEGLSVEYRTFLDDLIQKLKAYIRLVEIKKHAEPIERKILSLTSERS